MPVWELLLGIAVKGRALDKNIMIILQMDIAIQT
jgi:hypothetical protein